MCNNTKALKQFLLLAFCINLLYYTQRTHFLLFHDFLLQTAFVNQALCLTPNQALLKLTNTYSPQLTKIAKCTETYSLE